VFAKTCSSGSVTLDEKSLDALHSSILCALSLQATCWAILQHQMSTPRFIPESFVRPWRDVSAKCADGRNLSWALSKASRKYCGIVQIDQLFLVDDDAQVKK
jgi:hypothetical protein